MSYTTYECDYKGIKASQTLMVPMDDAVELWDVRLKNTTDKERRISVFSYCEFSFHHIMIDNQNFQMSLYCAGSSYDENIIEYDLFYEEFGYQYFTSNVTPDGFECLRDSFLGAYRTETIRLRWSTEHARFPRAWKQSLRKLTEGSCAGTGRGSTADLHARMRATAKREKRSGKNIPTWQMWMRRMHS